MAKHSKKYRDALKAAPKAAVPLEEAVAFIKAHPGAKFDETVDVGIRLGADPTKNDQAVRGVVHLPHGTGKHVRVVVFAGGDVADAAKAAGADAVGLDDLIERVKGGWVDFDVAIATPDAMKQVRTVARVLGPRGLMPNPKTGTVTDQVGREGNYLETSGSSMFAYSILKGTRLGYLDPSLRGKGLEAVEAIRDRYLTEEDGEIHLGGICSVAGLGGNPYRDGSYRYYLSEKVVADDFKGVGSYILACTEEER